MLIVNHATPIHAKTVHGCVSVLMSPKGRNRESNVCLQSSGARIGIVKDQICLSSSREVGERLSYLFAARGLLD